MSRTLRIVLVTACLASLAAANMANAAEQSPTISSSTGKTEDLQEVTVTAQHLQLDWAQRNALVQKSASFVFGIAAVQNYKDSPARWTDPVCPLVTGLSREQGVFVFERVSQIARDAGARLGDDDCRPNLFIFVTDHPQELLRTMKSRRYHAIFGHATSSAVDQFIDEPAPVKVWHNTFAGTFSGPVNVVVDRTQLRDVSQEQLADYVGMLSLAQIKSTAHFGDAQTILRLFEGPPQTAPESLSNWDETFLKVLYHPHPEPSLATPRSMIARRIVDELVPP
jgi:hypothetical protein